MRDDLISVKLESSSRLFNVARLEQQVRTLLAASGKSMEIGAAPTDSLGNSSPRWAPLPTVPLKSIGEGKPMQQWGAADVDQWLLLLGRKSLSGLRA